MTVPICPALDDFLRSRATASPPLDLLNIEIPEGANDPISNHLRERQTLLRLILSNPRGLFGASVAPAAAKPAKEGDSNG